MTGRYRFSRLSEIRFPVRGIYLGISDLVAAAFGIEDKVRSARYRIRDEANRITWVHDRLQGLVPKD